MKRTYIIVFLAFIFGCAKERPIKHVVENPFRIPKKMFSGNYLFLKSTVKIESPGEKMVSYPPGCYLISDEIVEFVINEKTLDVVRVKNPKKAKVFYDNRSLPVTVNDVLASFDIKHVDVLLKLNEYDENTHVEEQTTERRPWDKREYLILDTTTDKKDEFYSETTLSNPLGAIDFENGTINFSVSRHLKDNTYMEIKYSFLPVKESRYKPKYYSRYLETRFGFFKTVAGVSDKYNRITYDSIEQYAQRWDLSKPIPYYYSEDFPDHLKPLVKEVFQSWNKTFQSALGTNVDYFSINENSGQTKGDLRYNLIVYDETDNDTHGVLGYAPSVSNPWTGEIVKADVLLFGGVLKRSLFVEKILLDFFEKKPPKKNGEKNTSLLKPDIFNQFSVFNFNSVNELKFFVDEINRKMDFSYKKIKKGFREKIKSIDAEEILKFSKKRFSKPSSAFTMKVEDYHIPILYTMHENINLSDEDIEKAIFKPLLTHELGHNFGLRHNFSASSDKEHYGKNAETSSVMDYNYLSADQNGPHPYDEAAISVLYSDSDEKIKAALSQNFIFCTDNDAVNSRDALCFPFDRGSNLVEVLDNHYKAYKADYYFHNLRLNRLFFDESELNYFIGVMNRLLPIRIVFDNATTILSTYNRYEELKKSLEKETDNEKKGKIKSEIDKAILNLLALTNRRIAADELSKKSDIMTVFQPVGNTCDGKTIIENKIEQKVDISKLDRIINDAKLAKSNAFDILEEIVKEHLDEEELYGKTGLHNEIIIHGRLSDKLAALYLLGLSFKNPLISENSINPILNIDNYRGLQLLTSLLSGTVINVNEEDDLDIDTDLYSDINIRETAFDLLVNEISKTRIGAYFINTLYTQKVDVDRHLLNEIIALEEIKEIGKILALVFDKKNTEPFQVIGKKVFTKEYILEKVNDVDPYYSNILNKLEFFSRLENPCDIEKTLSFITSKKRTLGRLYKKADRYTLELKNIELLERKIKHYLSMEEAEKSKEFLEKTYSELSGYTYSYVSLTPNKDSSEYFRIESFFELPAKRFLTSSSLIVKLRINFLDQLIYIIKTKLDSTINSLNVGESEILDALRKELLDELTSPLYITIESEKEFLRRFYEASNNRLY